MRETAIALLAPLLMPIKAAAYGDADMTLHERSIAAR